MILSSFFFPFFFFVRFKNAFQCILSNKKPLCNMFFFYFGQDILDTMNTYQDPTDFSAYRTLWSPNDVLRWWILEWKKMYLFLGGGGGCGEEARLVLNFHLSVWICNKIQNLDIKKKSSGFPQNKADRDTNPGQQWDWHWIINQNPTGYQSIRRFFYFEVLIWLSCTFCVYLDRCACCRSNLELIREKKNLNPDPHQGHIQDTGQGQEEQQRIRLSCTSAVYLDRCARMEPRNGIWNPDPGQGHINDTGQG